MERRRRLIVGALWIAVAGIMAITIDPTGPMLELDVIARLFVVVLALFLAIVYVFDPFGLYDYGNAESSTHD